MRRYNVVISEKALKDMEKIFEYISYDLQSPIAARRQYNRIADAITSLDMFPERFPEYEDNMGRFSGMRRMTVDNYIVFYTVERQTVKVVAVLFSMSDISARLESIQ